MCHNLLVFKMRAQGTELIQVAFFSSKYYPLKLFNTSYIVWYGGDPGKVALISVPGHFISEGHCPRNSGIQPELLKLPMI